MTNIEQKTKKLPEQKEPFELYIKLESGETKVVHYACGVCHIPRPNYGAAKKCCEHYFCSVCGKDLGAKTYYSKCTDCVSKEIQEKTEIVEYTNQIIANEDGGNYFETIGEAIDHYYDDFMEDETSIPEYLFVCNVDKWEGIDIDNVIENGMENHHENAGDQIVDIEEIRSFVKEWNAKQKVESWNVFNKQKINFMKIMQKEKQADS
jgi:hypothetical protein